MCLLGLVHRKDKVTDSMKLVKFPIGLNQHKDIFSGSRLVSCSSFQSLIPLILLATDYYLISPYTIVLVNNTIPTQENKLYA